MSEVARPPCAVLDTEVIFSRVLYELFGRLAIEHEVLSLIWSEELLAEAQRVLVECKPLPAPSAERWVSYLRSAFPEGRVDLGAPGWGSPLALAVVETQAAAWGGGRSVAELVDALARARTPRFAAGLRDLLGS